MLFSIGFGLQKFESKTDAASTVLIIDTYSLVTAVLYYSDLVCDGAKDFFKKNFYFYNINAN